jgi:hypothetical protein
MIAGNRAEIWSKNLNVVIKYCAVNDEL